MKSSKRHGKNLLPKREIFTSETSGCVHYRFITQTTFVTYHTKNISRFFGGEGRHYSFISGTCQCAVDGGGFISAWLSQNRAISRALCRNNANGLYDKTSVIARYH